MAEEEEELVANTAFFMARYVTTQHRAGLEKFYETTEAEVTLGIG